MQLVYSHMSINTDNLMNDIINLNKVTDNKHMLSEELLSEIITPEWYYSDSQRIFENTRISWDSLLRSEFTNNIALNKNRSTIMRRDIVFEKSFCTGTNHTIYYQEQSGEFI